MAKMTTAMAAAIIGAIHTKTIPLAATTETVTADTLIGLPSHTTMTNITEGSMAAAITVNLLIVCMRPGGGVPRSTTGQAIRGLTIFHVTMAVASFMKGDVTAGKQDLPTILS
ncbi:MAG: hypothetical protein J5J00_05025 [Deltaproteobacteria bacterium]|nr:hypothetical protein [Deltaproteobacteria bacterium]